MGSNPNEVAGLSVTLKADGRDGMWMVFHGSPSAIRENLIEAFNFTDTDDQTLVDIAVQANGHYKGVTNAAAKLGAKPSSTGAWTNAARDADKTDPTAEGSEAPPARTLLDDLADCTDLTSHRQLWAEHRSEFEGDEGLMEAWKNRGRELRGDGESK